MIVSERRKLVLGLSNLDFRSVFVFQQLALFLPSTSYSIVFDLWRGFHFKTFQFGLMHEENFSPQMQGNASKKWAFSRISKHNFPIIACDTVFFKFSIEKLFVENSSFANLWLCCLLWTCHTAKKLEDRYCF